jgi:hypothetical protein
MAFGIPSLPLSPFWQKEQVLLVRTTDATRLLHEGSHTEVPRQQSLPYLLEAERRRVDAVRDFVAMSRVLSLPVGDCPDALLFAQLRKLVEVGTLVLVRTCDAGAASETSSLVKQRRTIRTLDQTKPQALKFEGRTYRLVADADLGRIPDRDNYTVVGHADAIRVLEGLAKLAAPAQAAQFREACRQLTRDWRPPMSPDGIVLLKRIVVPQSVPKRDVPLAKAQKAAGSPAAAEAPAEEEACRPCAALRQAQQAAVLSQAAQDGTPFCSECGPPSSAAAQN